MSLMMTFALAIKENFTIKSQNRVAMVQISWEITRWCYGCTFRLDLVLLNTWVFWVITGLDAPILKTMSAEASNCNLTFCKTRQLVAWLQVSPKWQVQTGFQAYSSKRKKPPPQIPKSILSIKSLSGELLGKTHCLFVHLMLLRSQYYTVPTDDIKDPWLGLA